MKQEGAKRTWGSVMLVAFFFAYGCAPKVIKTDEGEIGRLKHTRNILAIHYPPESFQVWRNDPVFIVGATFGFMAAMSVVGTPVALLIVEGLEAKAKWAGGQVAKDLSLKDPVPLVKATFISTWEKNLDLKNIRVVPDPVSDEGLDELKNAFADGVVLDFKTLEWKLYQLGDETGTASLLYRARARLVRFEDSKLLWEEHCDLRRDLGPFSSSPPLQAGLNRAAEGCAHQLLDKFFGLPPRLPAFAQPQDAVPLPLAGQADHGKNTQTGEEAKSSGVAVMEKATATKEAETPAPQWAPVTPAGVPVFAHTAPGSQVLAVLQSQTVVTIELFTTGPEGDWCYITELRGKRRSGYVRCENLEWRRSPVPGPLMATVRLKE